ncbi:hypothetical protein WMY93_014897 [Mugilogobius chulae]|uniref:Uncharacterized protein n=1 Tax=Mugilogobius chulae TaxID=88201 RepID=A0AAW0P5Q6_9GOBI
MEESAVVEANQGLSDAPLVTVSFQRNEQRKLKFLEGEPQALGVGLCLIYSMCLVNFTQYDHVSARVQITQICLSLFHTSWVAVTYGTDIDRYHLKMPYFITSTFIIIAGSVAIAAKNLHLPTLRACLGLEMIASLVSISNLILTLIQLGHYDSCYYYSPEDEDKLYCQNIESTHLHFTAVFLVIHLAVFAISVTLVVYACKVANCCSPAPKVPVITIQNPPAAQ